MRSFLFFSTEAKYWLSGVLFIAVTVQFALCLYQSLCHEERVRRILDGGLFVCILVALSYVTAASSGGEERVTLPWCVIPLTAVILTARAFAKTVRLYRRSRRQISFASIKEALDNLNSGICFADRDGRIVLINRVMNDLAYEMIGSPPQVLEELITALQTTAVKSHVVKIDGADSLYRFSNGRIWRFRANMLSEKGLEQFTEMTAQDVTEIYEANLTLERENRALQETNEETERMMERLADRIREQETLRLKTQIHNDIGTSLIAISELMNRGTTEKVTIQLGVLENAVSYLVGNAGEKNDSPDELQRQAAQVKVRLNVHGRFPDDEPARTVIMIAVRECITNCAKHARGDRVEVHIDEQKDAFAVRITNNGEIPNAPVTEGGGLSNLRRRVETVGGQMRVVGVPCFALDLSLPKKEAKS